MDKKEMFERCAAFHGHVCGGLTIGFKAALYAMDLLGIGFSEDEDEVCISENDACGVDAIQVLLGCSVGKGNLLFHMTGKQAFSFYDRKSGRSVRLVLRPRPDTGQSGLDYYTRKEPSELFDVKETKIELPENARALAPQPAAGLHGVSAHVDELARGHVLEGLLAHRLKMILRPREAHLDAALLHPVDIVRPHGNFEVQEIGRASCRERV